MLPQDRMGISQPSDSGTVPQNSLLNNISSLGTPPSPEEEIPQSSTPTPMSPVERFTVQAGNIVTQLSNINETYPKAEAEPELRKVVQAIGEWMTKISGSLNSQVQTGASPAETPTTGAEPAY